MVDAKSSPKSTRADRKIGLSITSALEIAEETRSGCSDSGSTDGGASLGDISRCSLKQGSNQRERLSTRDRPDMKKQAAGLAKASPSLRKGRPGHDIGLRYSHRSPPPQAASFSIWRQRWLAIVAIVAAIAFAAAKDSGEPLSALGRDHIARVTISGFIGDSEKTP